MSMLARLLATEPSATPGPIDNFWYQDVGGVSSAGLRVTPEGSLRVSAVFAAVRLLSDTLAALPLLLYRRLPDHGGKERAANHPLYDLLHSAPNNFQDSYSWRRLMMRHILLRGAGYNFIVPGPRGFVDQLVPIHPDRVVKTEQAASGRLLFHIREKTGGMTRTYTQDDVWRLAGASEDGIECKSVLTYARDSVGLALATEGYASRLFSQGAMHGGVLSVPGLLNEEAADRMGRSFQKATTGERNWHRPVVLEQGAVFKETTMTAEDSQFILSRQFSTTDIARWFGVPPHMIGDLSRSTNNNIEQQSLEFVTYNLTPWLVLWEQAISRDLILAQQTYFAEFNVDGLLRGDSEARAAFFSKMFAVGAYSTNDIRRIDNQNQVEGGDQRFVPANFRPLDAPFEAGGMTPGQSADVPPAKPSQASQPDDSRARAIVTESAKRVQRKESLAAGKMAVKHASDPPEFAAWATEFYAGHVALVAQTMQITEDAARLYCESQRDDLIAHGLTAAETWTPDYLVGLALDVPAPDRVLEAVTRLSAKPTQITLSAPRRRIVKEVERDPMDED